MSYIYIYIYIYDISRLRVKVFGDVTVDRRYIGLDVGYRSMS